MSTGIESNRIRVDNLLLVRGGGLCLNFEFEHARVLPPIDSLEQSQKVIEEKRGPK
jgi:hypothetical protein